MKFQIARKGWIFTHLRITINYYFQSEKFSRGFKGRKEFSPTQKTFFRTNLIVQIKCEFTF